MRRKPTMRNAAGRRRAFTLVEVLVVMAIIALLAGFMMGVGALVRGKARVNRTKVAIRKIELVMEMHHDMFGAYPPDIGTDPDDTAAANLAVATVLRQEDAVGDLGWEINADGYVVDAWGNAIHIISGGFNDPDLDIWSSGPNETNDSTVEHTGEPEDYNPPLRYGDDIPNWRGGLRR